MLIDPWSAGLDPWASYTSAAAAPKKAKKEEAETVEDFDLAHEFGVEGALWAGASVSSAISSTMALSAEAAAIIATVNSNTDAKIGQATGRLDRHEGLIVDLGARVVALEREKALGGIRER